MESISKNRYFEDSLSTALSVLLMFSYKKLLKETQLADRQNLRNSSTGFILIEEILTLFSLVSSIKLLERFLSIAKHRKVFKELCFEMLTEVNILSMKIVMEPLRNSKILRELRI